MDILEQFLIMPDGGSQQPIDEYEEYCCLKPDICITNIIQWWQDHAAASLRLARMALDILSVPAMLGEVKWVFSSVKLLLPDSQNRLKKDAIEACECLKSWNAAGIIVS